MSTQQIKYALNELRTSVSNQVRSIKKDVSNLNIYKSNYDALVELPLVKQLLKENNKLKKQNRKLEKQLLSVLLENRSSKKNKNVHLSPVLIKTEKLVEPKNNSSENIVYEIIEDNEEVGAFTEKQATKGHINDLISKYR